MIEDAARRSHAHASASGSAAPAAVLFPPDKPAPESPHRARRVGSFLGWMIGGGLGGFALAFLVDHGLGGLPAASGWAALIAFVLAFWPQLILHEAGHALAGLSRGMRAVAFGIGPVRVERGGDDRWRWRRGGGIRGIAGFAALVPQRGRGLGTGDQMLFAAGGPLANLLSAAVCAGVALALPDRPALVGVLYGTAACGLLMAAVNLVPFHVQGWRSDGRGLLDLLRGHPDAALQLQVNQLMALSLAGVRPRDWPAPLLPTVVEQGQSPILGMVARLLRLSHAIDRRDHAVARDEALALAPRLYEAPEAYRSSIAVGLACYAAVMVGDARLIAAWRAHCEGGLMDLSPYRDWLDAEIACGQGDHPRASALAAQARAGIGRIHDAASRTTFEECLDRLEARLVAESSELDIPKRSPHCGVKEA